MTVQREEAVKRQDVIHNDHVHSCSFGEAEGTQGTQAQSIIINTYVSNNALK